MKIELNIVLLDDVATHNQQFKQTLTAILEERHIPAVIALEATRFEQVLEYAASDPPMTIYFLDIRLDQEQTGLDVCRQLRRDTVRDRVIFVSAYPHYAMDCLKLHAYDFLMKPVETSALEECIASLYKEITIEDQPVFDIRIGSRTIRIPVSQIYYLESLGRNLRVYTSQGIYTYADSLARLEELLADHHFIRTHRKYLVNSAYIEEWDTAADTIQVHGTKLPFSRRRQKALTAGEA